jgi:predicted nucleotidyltransferase
MQGRYADSLGELERHGLLPAAYEAVYAAGSLVRGWGNERSDFDVYVIANEPWESESAQIDSVALHPDSLPVESFYVDGRRWDVEYWLERQVDELFGKVSPEQLESIQPAAKRMLDPEVAFLERFSHAAPIAKAEWLEERKRQLEALPLDSMMALRALHMLDIYTEDVVGQLGAGDVEAAVLTAKIALRYAVDALLASHGQFGESPKWFARRYRAADPPELTFEEWWALETMRSYDSEAPQGWVEEVMTVCQRIASEVSVAAPAVSV